MADIREQLRAAFALEHRDHQNAIRSALRSASAGESVDIREIFRRAHSLKGAARAVGLPEVEKTAHTLETLFAEALESGALPAAAIDAARTHLDAIERLVTAPANLGPDASPAPATAATTQSEFVRVDSERVARLSSAMEELNADLDAIETQGAVMRDLRRDANALLRVAETLAQSSAPSRQALLQLVQHARMLSRAAASAERDHVELAWAAGRTGARLNEEIAGVALVSADAVFAGLNVMVRDMAAEEGVAVDFAIDGLETRADRRLLQDLRDPVIQLLRNALAHGAEPAEVRARKGKPVAIQIGLSIVASSGRLVLTVWDDGPGPDWAKLERVAVDRRLLNARAEDQPAPAADMLAALAFEPGFSTSDGVSQLAGRGMGLSIVSEAARKAGGGVHLRARQPHGAEIVISTPLSTARQSVLVVEAAGETYGLPSYAVERVVRRSRESLHTLDGRAALEIDTGGNKTLLPIVPLSRVVGGDAKGDDGGEGTVTIAILRQGDLRMGLRVDVADDFRAATLKSLDQAGVAPLNAAAMSLDGGGAAVVLNPEVIFQRYARGELEIAAAERPAAKRVQRTVLVVDDSMTTRTLEKGILEAQGYRVIVTVDGLDALEALRGAPAPVDIIIADVEMPRMDGLSLLQALKGDPALSQIPVVLMTSRADPADVQRGLELGADAYLVKQNFDQRELIATIRQLL